MNEFEKYKNIPVVQSSEFGIFIKEHHDIFHAAKDNDYDVIKLIDCINGKSKTSFHYKWFLKDNYKPKTSNKWRKIVKLSVNDEYICEYDSITTAAKYNNTFISSIYECCNGNRKTSGGFKWMYKEDYLNLIEKQ